MVCSAAVARRVFCRRQPGAIPSAAVARSGCSTARRLAWARVDTAAGTGVDTAAEVEAGLAAGSAEWVAAASPRAPVASAHRPACAVAVARTVGVERALAEMENRLISKIP